MIPAFCFASKKGKGKAKAPEDFQHHQGRVSVTQSPEILKRALLKENERSVIIAL